jgi:small subunit ribosomal protein S1
VYVLRVERERERIGLSRKRLLPDPWLTLTDSLNLGDVVEGTVTNVVDFGAFVSLDDGIEGLVHISEFPRAEQPLTAVQPGALVQVRVLRIDPQRRRISLSLRGLAAEQSMQFDPTGW